MANQETIYTETTIENVFQKLISGWDELSNFYHKEIKVHESDRLAYIDMADIARFIVKKKKANETKHFSRFFENTEAILEQSDAYIQNLIVIGLFEGIQNIGGQEIAYKTSYNEWLGPKSLKEWRKLINFWGG